MKRTAQYWTLLLVALAIPAHADDPLRPEQFAVTVEVAGAASAGPFQRVPLPIEVLRHTRSAEFGDLRVFDARGALLPFALYPVAREGEASTDRVELVPLPISARAPGELATGRLIVRQRGAQTTVEIAGTAPAPPVGLPAQRVVAYLFDARAVKAQAVALELDADFDSGRLVPVTIEASRDLKQWQTLASGEPVFRLGDTEGAYRKNVPLLRVKLDGENYLRLTWRNSETFTLRGARLTTSQGAAPPPAKVRLPLAPKAATASEVEFDLPSPLPIGEIDIKLGAVNTLVPLTVFARRRAGEPWAAIGRGVAYRLADKGAESVSPPIAVSAGSYPSLKIVADANGPGFDGTPEVALLFAPREIAFLARGDGPFLIAAGRADTRSASLPLPSLMPGYKSGAEQQLPAATIGRAQINEQRVARPTRWLGIDARNWALWGVLVGAVLILAAFAWRLARTMSRAPAASTASTANDNSS